MPLSRLPDDFAHAIVDVTRTRPVRVRPGTDLKLSWCQQGGDYVTVHMRFAGHFTGTFCQAPGQGQAISCIATDLVKIENGRITDNWLIEDNLTLLQQMGVDKVAS